ncbi:hypothetical protein LX36DRAFT_381150 [Colletotrichum falcatum]|nr:hypothetical protein LX36DRAFT_381150 [Colletotrichum falcatum]
MTSWVAVPPLLIHHIFGLPGSSPRKEGDTLSGRLPARPSHPSQKPAAHLGLSSAGQCTFVTYHHGPSGRPSQAVAKREAKRERKTRGRDLFTGPSTEMSARMLGLVNMFATALDRGDGGSSRWPRARGPRQSIGYTVASRNLCAAGQAMRTKDAAGKVIGGRVEGERCCALGGFCECPLHLGRA